MPPDAMLAGEDRRGHARLRECGLGCAPQGRAHAGHPGHVRALHRLRVAALLPGIRHAIASIRVSLVPFAPVMVMIAKARRR
jgi:hypothetical protein